MAEETHYTANTGMATISTANSNRDGSGILGTVLTAASPGTLIKSVCIKAQGNTDAGTVRLFIRDSGGNKFLIHEILIPAERSAATNKTFETQVILNMTLKSGYKLLASTEKANTFNIIAEGMDWSYYASSVRPDTTQWTAANGRNKMTTANSRLDGTGTLYSVFQAGTSATYKGASIRSITVKSDTNVTSGMVRIFLCSDAETCYLLTEVNADTDTKSAIDEAFERTILFDDDFDLQADYIVKASTEVGSENFHVIVEATDWNYAS